MCSDVNVGLRTYLMSSREESEIQTKTYLHSVSDELMRELTPITEFAAYGITGVLDKEAVFTLSNKI
jgi:hypothetical protein